jgi:hypothetical protein
MKFLQLFCDLPSDDVFNDLLRCYGLMSLSDTKEFHKGDLIENNTVDKLYELLPELILYYLPCKANIYLNDITEKRAITILSQNLKLFDHRLSRDERIVNKKKIIFYKIQRIEDTKIHILRDENLFEVDFE